MVMYEGVIVQIGTPSELFERPSHTFVGYFIGSPGMNVFPIALDGAVARLGNQSVDLPGSAKVEADAKTELGVRPEYVQVGRQGLPITVHAVEDIGRHKIVRARLDGLDLAAIVPEHGEIPADPHITFDPKGINIYANSWRQDLRG